MPAKKTALFIATAAALSACGGGSSTPEPLSLQEQADNRYFAAFDGLTDLFDARREGSIARSEIPTTGEARYDGTVYVAIAPTEPDAGRVVGVRFPTEQLAGADMVVTANFADGTLSGSADNFLGVTASPYLPQITDEDGNIIQQRERPTTSNQVRYEGEITFNGTVDTNLTNKVGGSLNGRIEAGNRNFNLNDFNVEGDFYGSAQDRLIVSGSGTNNQNDTETITAGFIGNKR